MKWLNKTLAEVCLPITRMDPVETGRHRVQYVDIGAVDGVHHTLNGVGWVESTVAPSRCRQVLRSGDTIFSTVRPYLEKIAYIHDRLDGEFASTGFCVLRPNHEVEPRFLFHYATSHGLLDQVLPKQKGVSYPAVLDREVRSCQLPVPPIDEQQRIVSILEEHLSDLDAAASSLRRASATCQALVTRSLSLVRSGNQLPLPKVAVIQGGIQKQAKRAPRRNAFPFLRVANVTASGLDLGEVHQIELFNDELARYRLQAGDLLVVEGNGSPSQIGRAALWDGSIPDCVHQNHLIRVRPDREKILPEYLEAVWNAPENRSVLTHVASSSSGLHTLSVRKLAQLQIPVPSLARQIAAVSDLRQVRESVSRLQASISESAARGESLRRAVLAAAFAGRLTGRGADTEVIEELAEEESE